MEGTLDIEGSWSLVVWRFPEDQSPRSFSSVSVAYAPWPFTNGAYSLFDRIDRNGGFFISRVKTNANPLIVANNRPCRGRSVVVVGKRLKDVLGSLERQVLDVQVEVRFRRRAWAATRRSATRTFRLVAMRDDDARRYHCFLTNVSVDDVEAETIAETYRLRWQGELVFKCLRSHGRLGHVPSRKRAIVDAFLWASLLGALASHALYLAVRRAVAADRHIPMLRWSAVFSRVVDDVMRIVLGDRHRWRELERLLLREAPDPNRNRPDRALHPGLLRQWI